MNSEGFYNPYIPPSDEAQNTDIEGKTKLPAVLCITRGPLADFEKDRMRFSVEQAAVAGSNRARTSIAGDIEHVIDYPMAIFSDLKRENFENACGYSGKGCDEQLVGYVIMVYVHFDETLEEFVVFDWDLRAESKDDAGFPIGWQNDLGVLKWRR